MTTILQFCEAKKRLGREFNRVEYGRHRVVITRRNRESVAIVSMEDFRALEAFEQAAKTTADAFETEPLPAA